MPYKFMLIALLGLFLTGCAVYGDGYGHRYSGYDRHYYSGGDYRVQRYPVYVAPRHYGYDDRRHVQRRYDAPRHDQRRYLPAPQTRYYNHDRRAEQRHDGRRDQRYTGRRDQRGQDYRAAQPRQGWNGKRLDQHDRQQRSSNRQPRGQGPRSDDRRGWESRRN
ncbi:hypothetical protein P8H27_16140 [Pseudomonas sp. sp1636]|uniref:hypothetical protein n=1 Tax=Pseudomonas sp. sp1636 TaxID=3036707 RepID=UPI0025A54D41|nr:hypothetical protein [Pseudomonas sp. sp1636]MDM8350405.1 hypothetical protein [Pseudomonas sp. sp1636]